MTESPAIITLRQAREGGLVRYFTGKPCKRGHVDWRSASSATCLACDREKYQARAERRRPQMRAYQERNRELVRQAARNWKAANPEPQRVHHLNRKRRLKGSGTVRPAEVAKLHERQGYRCAACRTSTRASYHIDHVQPIARGGLNVIGNLQILCPRCNHSKHAKDPFEWARQRGLLL